MARYRDRNTGKFVSESTWKRSKAQGGTRYVRVQMKTTHQQGEKRKTRVIASKLEPVPELSEYVLHFDYEARDPKSRDVFYQVHMFGPKGSNDKEIIAAARQYGEHESTPRGWSVKKIEWSANKKRYQSDRIAAQEAALTEGKARVGDRRNR